jgi:hypothetical protein
MTWAFLCQGEKFSGSGLQAYTAHTKEANALLVPRRSCGAGRP